MNPYERRAIIRRMKAAIDEIECKIRDVEDERHTQLSPNGVDLLRNELGKTRLLLARLKKEEEE